MDVKKMLEDIYLYWWDNYLTVEKFAEHQEMNVKDMESILDIGRHLYKWRNNERNNIRDKW